MGSPAQFETLSSNESFSGNDSLCSLSGNESLRGPAEGATLRAQGQQIGEQIGACLARRRFQKGSLFLRGGSWVLRWREDVIENGSVRRIYRSEVLGSKKEYPTRKLALREAQDRLGTVNSPNYRARPTATFRQFAARWQSTVLPQHKPSTRATMRSHIGKYLVPCLGDRCLKDINPELVQQFVAGLKTSPKTVRNIYVTLQLMWKSARAWLYVSHDAVSGVVLPKAKRAERFFFTLGEVQRILATGTFCVWPKVGRRATTIEAEPLRTFYWLAAETGLRAGELCGIRVDDLDLERCLLRVEQSVWHGKIQSPKTENSIRSFSISWELASHVRGCLARWRPNSHRLIFATRNGTPWDDALLRKRKLHPLLRALGIASGIKHVGLHAFRHANETLMDRFGVPLKVRQQRLGHSDARLTLNVYTHVESEDDMKIARQLGQILHPFSPIEKGKGPAPGTQALVN
jgi:integrase